MIRGGDWDTSTSKCYARYTHTQTRMIARRKKWKKKRKTPGSRRVNRKESEWVSQLTKLEMLRDWVGLNEGRGYVTTPWVDCDRARLLCRGLNSLCVVLWPFLTARRRLLQVHDGEEAAVWWVAGVGVDGVGGWGGCWIKYNAYSTQRTSLITCRAQLFFFFFFRLWCCRRSGGGYLNYMTRTKIGFSDFSVWNIGVGCFQWFFVVGIAFSQANISSTQS